MSGRPRPASEHGARNLVRVALSSAAATLVLVPLLGSPAWSVEVPVPGPSATASPTPTVPGTTPLPTPTLPPIPLPTPTPIPTPPPPVPSAVLPVGEDVVPSYQSQRSCDPAAKPGVEAYAQMVMRNYGVGRSGGIVRGCGIGATSEHKEGRAFDYMLSVKVPAEKAAGDSLTAWLTGPDDAGVMGGNARRLGVMYVIWNRRIWSTYSMGSGWKAYHGASAHTDHVHTSFSWDGALQRTSWWSGTAVSLEDKGPCRVYVGQPAPIYTAPRRTACPSNLPAAPASPYSIVWPGQSTSSVKIAQARLGLAADGVFGSVTRTRLLGWQRTTAVPVTGVLDKPTWAVLAPAPPSATVPPPPAEPVVVAPTTSLTPYLGTVLRKGARGSAVRALQRAVKVTSDGVFGGGTAAAVAAVQTQRLLPGTGVVDPATWAAIERLAYPLLPHRATVLQRGSTGVPVRDLERALRIPADEYFGPATVAAVKAAQGRARLPQTGVVDTDTWIAVEAAAYPLGARVVPATVRARTTTLSPYKDVVLRPHSTGLVVSALQQALGVPVDAWYGASMVRTVKSFQALRGLPVTGLVDHRMWNLVELSAYPLLPHRNVVLRVGSTGPAVAALQKALRHKADGVFEATTAAAVKAAQKRARLAATGVVTVPTWVAVEKQAYPFGVRRW